MSATVRKPPLAAPAFERRQLTVLFGDLVGSTALSARLDPEDMRGVIRAYQDACAGVITRFDGFVAKFMGDGVLAYFGYPRAHEDDAELAVRAGLSLVEAVASQTSPTGENLTARCRNCDRPGRRRRPDWTKRRARANGGWRRPEFGRTFAGHCRSGPGRHRRNDARASRCGLRDRWVRRPRAQGIERACQSICSLGRAGG